MSFPMHRADDVARQISPLQTAYRLQENAALAALDWPEACNVWSVINEELAEAKAACEDPSVLANRLAVRAQECGCGGPAPDYEAIKACLQESLGNLIFAVVDICRKLDVDPDIALNIANENFVNAYNYVQDKTSGDGILLGLEDPERIKALWMQARKEQRFAHKISRFAPRENAPDIAVSAEKIV